MDEAFDEIFGNAILLAVVRKKFIAGGVSD